MKVKTHDLSGAALDWAVLQIVKPELPHPERVRISEFGPLFSKGYLWPCYGSRKYNPSEDWNECGWLLEQLLKNGFNLSKRDFGAGYKCFRVSGDNLVCEYGDTAQHAICKTIVAYCSGDEVEIPSELLG